ncbi:hypothetical protein CHIBA101_2152 [Actinomyces sp. Chiba101]|uniref:hypothetical protein n=1 Tax=Actinomyces TaxID=1654 RepID=UPI000974E928|nr:MULTISPECIES: hypothetical protein [Actinomyces]BAW93980.1 hypothetical protein CHIBA101_2152 [Actinomyces sp. Chiba101]GAV93314.1 hypothetical protein ADENT20671_0056 [Actinomyces denticolens]SUU74480.1 Uncharacterised protein [Actinomyces denticolens]
MGAGRAPALQAIALLILVPRSGNTSVGAWVRADYVSDISIKQTARELALPPACAHRDPVPRSRAADRRVSDTLHALPDGPGPGRRSGRAA